MKHTMHLDNLLQVLWPLTSGMHFYIYTYYILVVYVHAWQVHMALPLIHACMSVIGQD